MHEQETDKPQKTGWKDKLWGSVALIILVLGALGFWLTIKKLPIAEWRNEFTPLSWKAGGVCIDDAEAYWKASAGDTRMELRSFNFPVCRLELGEATGGGSVTVRFLNGQGVQMGDRIYLHYQDGKFIPKNNNSMQVTETEATVRLEDGFLSRDEYILHQLDEHAPLWRVEVECRPDNGTPQRLGHLSVLPHDL